jgi:hypothetical protein
VDVSDVESVWQQVTQNKGEIDFAIFTYEKNSEHKLRVLAKGNGGIASAEENLRDGIVQFIVTKVTLQMHGTPIQKNGVHLLRRGGLACADAPRHRGASSATARR